MRERDRFNKKGTYSGAIERRMQGKAMGEGKENNFQKGPGKWTPEMWDQAGKKGKRPEHSFKSSAEGNRGSSFGRKGGTLFGTRGSGKARAVADFMPASVKSNNKKALRNQALERRLNKGK